MAQKPINFEQFNESFKKEKEFWKTASETLDDDEYVVLSTQYDQLVNEETFSSRVRASETRKSMSEETEESIADEYMRTSGVESEAVDSSLIMEKTDEMLDILDENWSQAEIFRNVFSHDEKSREILAVFETGSLTKRLLLESLRHLGWVSSDSAYIFLPQGWFMKMNMDTLEKEGRVSFVFLTETLEFCLNYFEAGLYMRKRNYQKQVIERFEENFTDDTLSESSCDSDSGGNYQLPLGTDRRILD